VITVLEAVFWLSLLGIGYVYFGYAVVIGLLARWRPRPVRTADIEPSVTVLVAAYNEESCIRDKIENTLALDYPRDNLELLIVTDGSTDRTNELVAEVTDPRVRLTFEQERRGKPAAVIRAFPLARGEIVVLSDANCLFGHDALRKLVRNFADPTVGGASGAKQIIRGSSTQSRAAEQGEGLYWRYEAYLKQCDSLVSSVMGSPGEIWAVRRSAFAPPDADSIADDFVASMRLVENGWRVVFEPEATASERASPSLRAEWVRRTRIAAGGWQALLQLPGMLRHKERLVTFQYLSHRMARWIVTPILFVVLLLSHAALVCVSPQPIYCVLGVFHAAYYVAALVGLLLTLRGKDVGWLAAPFYVTMLNAAALVGGVRFWLRRQPVTWQKARENAAR